MIEYQEIESNGKESVLFIHGLGASRWIWWQQIPAFSNYQLLLVDLPGHGKSVDTPWISLADTTNLIAEYVINERTVHVVGLSLGGHVALELAKHYPEKVRSVFISGMTVEPMSFRSLLKVQSWMVQRGQKNKYSLERLAREYYRLPLQKTEEFITNYQLMTRDTYETIAKEIMHFQLDESYSQIAVPCFIAAGSRESHGIRKSIEIAPQIIPSAEGRLIPSAQHAWPVQIPIQFNQILREWLIQNADLD